MPIGFTWCEYIDDLGRSWALRVDADYATDPSRGWRVLVDEQLPPAPRGLSPRVVFGIDELGRTIRTRVGRTDADLWTGVAQQWTFERSDLSLATVTRLGRLEEKRREPEP